jgi:death-on-curing protein
MKLTAQDVIRIHEDLIKSQSISPGYKSKDDIYSLIDKLDSKIFGNRIYDTPFKKGAALFEGIIRLHPFIDGNKRTALASLQQYMSNEGFLLIIPLSAVRLCIKIAQNRDNSEDGINNLINSLVKWIKYRSAEKERLGKLKEIFYSDVKLLKTVKKISKRRKDGSLEEGFVKFCIGTDIYPDNKANYKEILEFLENRYKIVLNYLNN